MTGTNQSVAILFWSLQNFEVTIEYCFPWNKYGNINDKNITPAFVNEAIAFNTLQSLIGIFQLTWICHILQHGVDEMGSSSDF